MSGREDAARVVEIAIVKVLTPAGPYSPGDVVSLAFTNPAVGRLRSHDGRSLAAAGPETFPEIILSQVICEAGPFLCEQRLVLAFVDPSLARIYPLEAGLSTLPAERCNLELPLPARTSGNGIASSFAPPAGEREPVPPPRPIKPAAITLRLRWSMDRVRRFIQVCDKLFTVERLGWYRHALVLRLLVPDAVRCADEHTRAEATQKLETLRAAVGDTLGNPLLATFMPNFNVTAPWLESLETAELARALTAFRGILAPHVADDAPDAFVQSEDVEETLGSFTRVELLATPFASIEAGLALLLPHLSPAPTLSEPLGLYRATLGELFGQMADTPERSRLKQMTQANHVLDDQLWQLVSGVQRTFEPVPAA